MSPTRAFLGVFVSLFVVTFALLMLVAQIDYASTYTIRITSQGPVNVQVIYGK